VPTAYKKVAYYAGEDHFYAEVPDTVEVEGTQAVDDYLHQLEESGSVKTIRQVQFEYVEEDPWEPTTFDHEGNPV
jgi:hypothetical protein